MIVANMIKKLKQIPNQNAKPYCKDGDGTCYEVYKINIVDGKPYFSIRKQEDM